MARLVTCGYEWQHAIADNYSTTGTVTFDTTSQRSGTVCAKMGTASPSSRTDFAVTAATTVTYYGRAYVSLGNLPAAASGGTYTVMSAFTGVSLGEIVVNEDGSWTWSKTSFTSSAGVFVVNTFALVEIAIMINTSNGALSTIEAKVNGVSAGSTASQGTSLLTAFRFGLSAGGSPGAGTAFVDDVAINDSTGAAQNTWVGDSSIVLLRPTADSAVGTGWTLGNTTATGGNAWQRENNIPPDSATDLTTTADATQIRNATSNANVNYDATMKTYTAAGVTGTVNVVVPQIATGAPVVTSAKAGTVGVASNPAISNVALGAGGTSGAFWSGVAVGTYPTGNKWSFGTTTYAPTVTLGTAPVMRVTQVTASTRIAIVMEMGMYVDYTPSVAALPPLPVYVDSAVARSTSY